VKRPVDSLGQVLRAYIRVELCEQFELIFRPWFCHNRTSFKKAVLFVLWRLLYSNQIDLSAIFAKENKKVIRLRQNTLQLAAGINGYVAISLDTPQLAAGSFIKQQGKGVGIVGVFD